MPELTADEIRRLDPYTLLAVLGKKVIRPGGRGATDIIFGAPGFHADRHVLDIGCGVGTTAIQAAARFGCRVTAVDIDQHMIDYAQTNIRRAGVEDRVTLKQGDIQSLPFLDDAFDVVTIEAVSMFTQDQQRAIRESVRVCKPGGLVFDHEFVWSRPPPPELRQTFESTVCTGMSFETGQDWCNLFRRAGQSDIQCTPVPFDVLTPRGMLRDEGLAGAAAIIGRALSRPAYIEKALWLLRVLARVSPYLGTVVVACRKNSDSINGVRLG